MLDNANIFKILSKKITRFCLFNQFFFYGKTKRPTTRFSVTLTFFFGFLICSFNMFFFKHITTKCSSCIYKSEQPDYLGRKAVDRNFSTGRYTTVALRSDRNTATPHTLWIYVNFNANLIEYIYIYQLYSLLFPPQKNDSNSQRWQYWQVWKPNDPVLYSLSIAGSLQQP